MWGFAWGNIFRSSDTALRTCLGDEKASGRFRAVAADGLPGALRRSAEQVAVPGSQFSRDFRLESFVPEFLGDIFVDPRGRVG
ncbi:hypothetical protein MPLA_2140027 [Mesorhizobium sp. ORS 3359]|nr:hypothetical protein MPLA_2140027 [Mesorhizobium sp. ORS 3359]